MYTQDYPMRRTYVQYDELRYLLYLNEEAVQYTPPAFAPEDGAAPAPVAGFRYTGDLPDGGTLIAAQRADYGEFVSGLIRLKYSANDEQALQSNALLALQDSKHANAAKWKEEFAEYQAYRDACKAQAKSLLSVAGEEG